MQVALTPAAAKELGRGLRFVRHARTLTLRDVAKRANLSPQYVQNIERGERTTVSEDAYTRLAAALEVPENVLDDLVLRARTHTALELRGLSAEDVAFVWRGVEQRLEERGISLRTDIAKVVVDILA
jgi:transcriptional regulator with XRE-family HTH domain